MNDPHPIEKGLLALLLVIVAFLLFIGLMTWFIAT